ncbi:MAG: hypothetical protein NT120_02850 [Candidatus Aenigmarchaeota archaeon]|nr:hypothetical protein [Candidatus Aenigmarchaeota archaeon]
MATYKLNFAPKSCATNGTPPNLQSISINEELVSAIALAGKDHRKGQKLSVEKMGSFFQVTADTKYASIDLVTYVMNKLGYDKS